ncbi:hypothetical protein, partial [Embleya sp. NPDC005575]|uniref:hypothetical protein n=1 Tax=Embleya sp. NPDC005575 TaxID=3156892 RepID=UPI0033A3E8CB
AERARRTRAAGPAVLEQPRPDAPAAAPARPAGADPGWPLAWVDSVRQRIGPVFVPWTGEACALERPVP